MEFICKLFDAKRWMDGKLINMADQIRAWQTDFFCKINRHGGTIIRQLRVDSKITNRIILNNFQVNTCPIDRKAFKAIIIFNRLGGNEISREAIKEKISTNDENVVYDDTTLCEICGCGDRGESLLLCDGTVNTVHNICLRQI